MIKLIYKYTFILLAVFLVLYFLGSKDDYLIEKKIWQVQKQYQKLQNTQDAIPEQFYDKIIQSYLKIIKDHPHSDLIRGLYISIGNVYSFKQDHVTARKKYYEIMVMYPEDFELHSKAFYSLGKTYEQEANWPEALKFYKKILNKFPLTEIGLKIPLYIANYHRKRNNFNEAMDAYEVAIHYYIQLGLDHPDSKIEFVSLGYLSESYLLQKRWIEAIEILKMLLFKYANSGYLNTKNADMIIKTINKISAFHLKDYTIAVKIYKEFIAKNPSHLLSNYLQKMIDAFGQLKKENVETSTEGLNINF